MSLSAPFGAVGAYEGLRRTAIALVYYIPCRAMCKDNASGAHRLRGARDFGMTGRHGPQDACQGRGGSCQGLRGEARRASFSVA
ncbi:protein of unknown function (plasmid) [Cupriavidus neocaledonicus]|uniref:Uncharacterized protein n=1 Tax=Cupriavidus neocaledonicus TaxID=1040979 RepID=A0A375HMS0_9BURK|nr:hypothetical protein CBM2605_B130132 [Cupriavidus neocaledonicus]SPD59521.1 protein of unknown function [Cupriavidus neocaledonicus]